MNALFDLEGRVAAVIGGTGVLGGVLCQGLADAGGVSDALRGGGIAVVALATGTASGGPVPRLRDLYSYGLSCHCRRPRHA